MSPRIVQPGTLAGSCGEGGAVKVYIRTDVASAQDIVKSPIAQPLRILTYHPPFIHINQIKMPGPGVGFEYPPQEVSWTKRDALLFANSIGATSEELHFLYVCLARRLSVLDDALTLS
jgi:hypothetical protein